MSWNPNKPYDVIVGTFSFVSRPSKTSYGHISITRVVRKFECSNYFTACDIARDVINRYGTKYACSIVPHGMQANCLVAIYEWDYETLWHKHCDR